MYARQYLENDVLGRTPIELVRLLYSKALEKLRGAVEHTGQGGIRERSLCLARVMQIIAELQGALDADTGGEIAVDLARLYDYCQQRLAEAAADPLAKEPIEEVETVLTNLYEGWIECEPEADAALLAPAEEKDSPSEEVPAEPASVGARQVVSAGPRRVDTEGSLGRAWTL